MKRDRSFGLELLINKAWQMRGYMRSGLYPTDYMRGYLKGQYLATRDAIHNVKWFGNHPGSRSLERRRKP